MRWRATLTVGSNGEKIELSPERVILIMGRRGSGKTNLAKVIAEEFYLHYLHKCKVLVYDPMKEYPPQYLRLFTIADVDKLIVQRGLLGLKPAPSLAIFDELSATLRHPKKRKVVQPVLIELVVSGRKWGVVPVMIVQSARTLRYLQDVYENISDIIVFDILPGAGTLKWIAEVLDMNESRLKRMIKNLKIYHCLHIDLLSSWRNGEQAVQEFKPRLAQEITAEYEARRIIDDKEIPTLEKVGILAFHYGLANEKIAELLGLTPDSVKVLKSRYKAKYLKRVKEITKPKIV